MQFLLTPKHCIHFLLTLHVTTILHAIFADTKILHTGFAECPVIPIPACNIGCWAKLHAVLDVGQNCMQYSMYVRVSAQLHAVLPNTQTHTSAKLYAVLGCM